MRLVLLAACALPLLSQPVHEACKACHTEEFDDFKSHRHFAKGLSCDACHGPSLKHRQAEGHAAPDKVAAPDEVPALCGACHAAQRKEYEQSKHAQLVLTRSKTKAANCLTCHGVHNLRTQRQMLAQCQRCHATPAPSHPQFAAGTSCMTCHAKHTLLARK